MNIFSVISLVIAFGVLYTGLYLSSPKMELYLDYPSMFIVIGGSVAATAISFHLNKIFVLFKIFFRRVIRGRKENFKNVVLELIKTIDALRKGKTLADLAKSVTDDFLRDAIIMIQDGILKPDEILQVLEKRNDNLAEHYMSESNKVKSVSKFPPAFGMIGTTIGMIVLLDGLGAEDAMKKMGPAMGVCLITTLYGAVISNLILIPIAENLTENTQDIHLKNRIIIEGVDLIMQKANPILAAERLNSFLPPGERLDWKKVLKG